VAGDWRIVVDYQAVDAFLDGPVAEEIALLTGPPIAEGARLAAPVGVTSPRPGRLKSSIYWAPLRDALGPFTQVGGRIWDMDLEAPADQLHRRYGGLVSSLRDNLPPLLLL